MKQPGASASPRAPHPAYRRCYAARHPFRQAARLFYRRRLRFQLGHYGLLDGKRRQGDGYGRNAPVRLGRYSDEFDKP